MATLQQSINNAMPVWNDDIWGAVEKKNYQEAEKNLARVLARYSSEEWEDVQWQPMWEGLASVRSTISEHEWRENIRPLITKAIFDSANPEKLAIALGYFDRKTIAPFLQSFSALIPGANRNVKIDWLKNNKPLLHIFFKEHPELLLATKSNTQPLKSPPPPPSSRPVPPQPSKPVQDIEGPIEPMVEEKPKQMFKVPVDVGHIDQTPENQDKPKVVHYHEKKTNTN